MSERLDDPEFEPSDAQLCDVAVRAFARIQDVHGLEVEHIRRDIAAAREAVFRVIDARGSR